MKLALRRIWLSLEYIAKTAATWTGFIYALIGFLCVFVSFEGLFPVDATFWYKFWVSAGVLAGIYLVCAIVLIVIVLCQNKKKVADGYNGKGVYLLYGDLFDPKIVKGEKRYIGFAVNRCFDTIVDDDLISATSVHGIAFNKLYSQNLHTPQSLDAAIQGAIKGNPAFTMVAQADKPKGNLKRYEVGAYANLTIDSKLNYLLLGLTWFNSNLNAKSSKKDYVLAIQKMIETFDMEAQGYPVLIPIIGTGRSHTDLTENEALEYMIEAIKINQEKVTSDIYIVVYEDAKNRVSISNF